ncbi:MAG: porin [Candidatus Brocadiales bacterium]
MDFLKGIDFSGFVDTYYGYNFNRPESRGASAGTDNPNALRSFDVHDNSFTLNNVELIVMKEATEDDPVGFGFVTMYGEQANFVTFVPSHGRVDLANNSFTIQQGFVTYKAPIGNGIDIKMGKFATWIGAEFIESVDNPNYSRSLLYQNAIPFTNTGLAVGYDFTDKLTITGFLVNGWDTFVDNNSGKTLGYQIAYDVAENLSVYFNGSHGPEQPSDNAGVAQGFPDANTDSWRHFFDLVIIYSPFDKLKFNLNYDHGTEENVGHWHGVSLISQYFFTDAIDVAVRGEYFKDSGSRTFGGFIGDPSTSIEVYEATVTLNVKVRQNLYLRPEVRYDWASGNDKVFASSQDGVGSGIGRDDQFTAIIGVAYLF